MKNLTRGIVAAALLCASLSGFAQVTGSNTAGPTIQGPITANDCVKWISASVIGPDWYSHTEFSLASG